jgi:hypothetical protein
MTPTSLRRKKHAVIALAVVSAGLTGAVYALAGKGAATSAPAGARGPDVLVATAPPVPASLAQSPELRAMARLARIDPTALREVAPAGAGHGAIVSGRSAAGSTCVAEASTDEAGSFRCDPFASGPVFLVTESRGRADQVESIGFAGAAEPAVRAIEVRVADGSVRSLTLTEAGGFAYAARDPSAFPEALVARDARGTVLATIPIVR